MMIIVMTSETNRQENKKIFLCKPRTKYYIEQIKQIQQIKHKNKHTHTHTITQLMPMI